MATELKHTIKPSGGDFTSLDAAADHLEASHHDLITADVYAALEIDGDWNGAPDTAAVILTADTGCHTDATHYVWIYATGLAARTSASPIGIDTTKYVLSVSNAYAFYVRLCNFVKLDGLQIVSAAQSAAGQNVFEVYMSGAGNVDVSNCIFKGSNNATYYQMGLEIAGGSPVVNMWNCLWYNFRSVDSNSRVLELRGASTNIYSTTIIGGYYGLMRAAGTAVAKNTYAGGSTNGDFYGTITETNCASADTTAGGTNHTHAALDTDTFVNVTPATADYHLAADGLSPLQATGVDTTGDAAPLNFTTDIDGQTRDATWDIGADAWVVAGGNTYNESITLSSTPACSHSPKVDFSPSLAAFASTPALLRSAQADLLGGVNLASTPALSRAATVDMVGGVTMLSNPTMSMTYLLDIFPSLILSSSPALSVSTIADFYAALTLASTPVLSPVAIADLLGSIGLASIPAMSITGLLDIFPSLILASNPALAVSAIADFYNSLTLASTPAAVMAAVADLIASLALASDPAFAVVGGSDFYESLALSSSPALSSTVFKAAFGELSLASSPALSAAAIADLYAAITMATSAGISTAALADFFIGLTLSSTPALSALGQIGGEVIQKMVMESIGLREKLLRTKKQEADGDIDIRNLILTNPYDEIAPVSTTWERTEKIRKDVQ